MIAFWSPCVNRRFRLFRIAFSISFAAATFAAARHTTLDTRIAHLLSEYPDVARAQLGYKFVDVDSARVLAEHNASTFFAPASNVKLYTTAAALARLGPSYTFK